MAGEEAQRTLDNQENMEETKMDKIKTEIKLTAVRFAIPKGNWISSSNYHLWRAPAERKPGDASQEKLLREALGPRYGTAASELPLRDLLTLLSFELAFCHASIPMNLDAWKAAHDLGLGLEIDFDDPLNRLPQNLYAPIYWRSRRKFVLIGERRKDCWKHDPHVFYAAHVGRAPYCETTEADAALDRIRGDGVLVSVA